MSQGTFLKINRHWAPPGAKRRYERRVLRLGYSDPGFEPGGFFRDSQEQIVIWTDVENGMLVTDVIKYESWLATITPEPASEPDSAPPEPEGQVQFSGAYRARNGHVVNIGMPTTSRADAQAVVDTFHLEDDEGPSYFVAIRILPPWVPVKQEGATE